MGRIMCGKWGEGDPWVENRVLHQGNGMCSLFIFIVCDFLLRNYIFSSL